MRCGKPLRREEREYCRDCQEKDHRFICGLAAFPYRGIMRGSVQRMKFKNRREYLDGYAWYMARQIRPVLPRWQIDLICPIPLHPAKRRKRGFDQAGLLAVKLGRLLELPVDTVTLERVRNTRSQKLLPGSERTKNVAGAFACRKDSASLRGKRILLVDDVYTTGATADSAAGALLDAGAAGVYLLMVCIGDPGEDGQEKK